MEGVARGRGLRATGQDLGADRSGAGQQPPDNDRPQGLRHVRDDRRREPEGLFKARPPPSPLATRAGLAQLLTPQLEDRPPGFLDSHRVRSTMVRDLGLADARDGSVPEDLLVLTSYRED